jgi:hypothetical protein
MPHIDLYRDLPKIRAAYEAGEIDEGSCYYSGPCAVGVLFDLDTRVSLDSPQENTIETHLANGKVTAPGDQWADWADLQRANDYRELRPTLERLEKKYAP